MYFKNWMGVLLCFIKRKIRSWAPGMVSRRLFVKPFYFTG
uniref:Uncharacterized protein n=1 Tax=Rhizophora mucronata TaxID=61149 RepID=A0A2P2N0V1_RHIMU